MDNILKARLQHAVETTDGQGNQIPASDSVPLNGEIVFNSNRTNFKVGNGSTPYSQLTNVIPEEPDTIDFYKLTSVSNAPKISELFPDDLQTYSYKKIVINGLIDFHYNTISQLQDDSTLKCDYYTIGSNIASMNIYYNIDTFLDLATFNENTYYDITLNLRRTENFSVYIKISNSDQSSFYDAFYVSTDKNISTITIDNVTYLAIPLNLFIVNGLYYATLNFKIAHLFKNSTAQDIIIA